MAKFVGATLMALSVIWCGADTIAQPSSKSDWELLRTAYPDVSWDTRAAKTADVACDGHPVLVAFGSTKTEVLVALVTSVGDHARLRKIQRFPIAGGRQDGFCRAPTQISLSKHSCTTDEYGRLPGCRTNVRCVDFSLDDDDCDPFNFYWDVSRRALRWWRN
jgi:hypothetical protein